MAFAAPPATTISTLRLLARPSAVSLLATGLDLPLPTAVRWLSQRSARRLASRTKAGLQTYAVRRIPEVFVLTSSHSALAVPAVSSAKSATITQFAAASGSAG
jgi:hypothetical protein